MFIRDAAKDFATLEEHLPEDIREQVKVQFTSPGGTLWGAAEVILKYGDELKRRAEEDENDATLAVAEALIAIGKKWHRCFNQSA